MALEVEREPLTAEEEALLKAQVLPILHTVLPEKFVPRALDTIRLAIEQSKKRHGMAFGGILPASGQIGVHPLTPREFDLDATWTFRKEWTATGWQTLIDAKTTSKYTHLVICAYENLEPTVRVLAVKETMGGVEHPIIDLTEIKKSDRQIQPIEPYIVSPISVATIEVFVESKGYDDTRPWGFVVAPYAYLVSKTFIA